MFSQNDKPDTCLPDLYPDFKQCLGKGSFGQVYSSNDPAYVSKVFESYRDGIQEYNFLERLSQCSINECRLSYHSIIYRPDNHNLVFEYHNGRQQPINNQYVDFYQQGENDSICINLTRYDYNLNAFTRKMNLGLKKWPIRILLLELFKSYNNLYQNFLIHGDIKMDNVLVKQQSNNELVNNEYASNRRSSTERSTLKLRLYSTTLCDFSLTFNQIGKAIPGMHDPAELKYLQTPNYRAPELVLGNSLFDYKIDIWSMGILILKIVCDKKFFSGPEQSQQITNICRFFGRKLVEEYCTKNNLNVQLPVRQYLPQKKHIIKKIAAEQPELADLLDKMLTLDPQNRITLPEIFKHQYFTGLVSNFKDRDPKSYLDKYFSNFKNTHTAGYNMAQLNRSLLFTKVYKYLLSENISIHYLFQAIHLFDKAVLNYNVEYSIDNFLSILKIVGYNRFNIDKLVKLFPNTDPDLIMNTKYYKLLALLKSELTVFSYLDYLIIAGVETRTNRDHEYWHSLIELLGDVSHYHINNKMDYILTKIGLNTDSIKYLGRVSP